MTGLVSALSAQQTARPFAIGAGGERLDIARNSASAPFSQNAQQNEAPRGAISVLDQAAVTSTNRSTASSDEAQEGGNPQNNLTPEEEAEVRELEARDREVRAHEQAHAIAGGPYAGQPSYETVTGPDGQQYAVAGEVQIDAAPIEGNPEASIQKLETVIRAALAPREPSTQDRAVARQARADLVEARQQLREQRQAELEGGDAEAETGNRINENPEARQAADAYQAIQNLVQSSGLFGGSGSF